MGRQLTISFYTVRSPGHYGMSFSAILDCIGLCLIGWRICLPVGGQEVVLGVLWCGRWSLFACCGVCGGREMRNVLRILRGPWRSLSLFFFISLFTWTLAYLAPLVINFPEFLVIFSSSP